MAAAPSGAAIIEILAEDGEIRYIITVSSEARAEAAEQDRTIKPWAADSTIGFRSVSPSAGSSGNPVATTGGGGSGGGCTKSGWSPENDPCYK